MSRLSTSLLLCCVLSAVLCGCEWQGGGEVSLRNARYPYDAALAVDDGSTPQPLEERGVTFAWSGQRVGTVGQDAMCSLIDRGRQLWESLVCLYRTRQWQGGSFFSNRLIEPLDNLTASTTTEGRVQAFKTCVGRIPVAGAGIPDEVAEQVAEAALYELKAKGGLSIIGSPAAGPEGQRSAARLPASVQNYLKGEHDAGRLHLMTLGRLLAYDFVRRNLIWSAARDGSDVTIRIQAVDDGIGTRWVPTVEELDGITFYTPDASATRVFVDGEEIRGIRTNERDRTRRESVTIESAVTLGAE